MNQAVQCPACFHVFQAELRYAGTAVACHQCGTPTLVPASPRVELVGHAPPGSVENATARVLLTIFRITFAVALAGGLLTLVGLAVMKWLYII